MAGLGYAQIRLHASWEFGSDLSIPQIGKVRGILVSSCGRKDPQTAPNSNSQDWRGCPPAAETSPLLTLVRSKHHHRNQRSSLIPDLFRAVSGFGMTSITESIRASPWLSLIQELCTAPCDHRSQTWLKLAKHMLKHVFSGVVWSKPLRQQQRQEEEQ